MKNDRMIYMRYQEFFKKKKKLYFYHVLENTGQQTLCTELDFQINSF